MTTVYAGSSPAKAIANTTIRRFEAYLEFLDSLDELLTKGTQPEPWSSKSLLQRRNFLDVIGFTLTAELNRVPTCQIALPGGELVANTYHQDRNIIGSAGLSPVKGKEIYADVVRKKQMASSYKACILWYKEHFDATSDSPDTFKPIFKGVVSHDSFTKIAYTQSNASITVQHWLYLLDNVMTRNVFVNNQSSTSVHLPWLRKTEKPYGRDESTNCVVISNTIDEALKRYDGEIKLNQELVTHLVRQLELEKGYLPMYESFAGAQTATMKTIVLRNLDFGVRILEFIKSQAVGQQPSDPAFTSTNVGPGVSGTTGQAFTAVAEHLEQANKQGQTPLQYLTRASAELCLDIVCTANCVKLEAINYRPKTWGLSEPITNAISVAPTGAFTRDIAMTVGALNLTGAFSGNHRTDQLNPPDGGGTTGHSWVAGYIEPRLDAKTATLASMLIFDMPRWYAVNKGPTRVKYLWEPAKRTQDVVKESHDSGDASGSDPTVTLDPSAYKIVELMHYKAKAKGFQVMVTTPLDIRIVQGMPLCVKGLDDDTYYSGIVTRVQHRLSQASLQANTDFMLSYVESFVHRGMGEPTQNPNNSSGDDKNPLYTNTLAFKRRALYA